MIDNIRNKHQGRVAWIIGKGPSLESLDENDIGDGIIIALNEAIVAIEGLDINNVVYSMQKDGGAFRTKSTDNCNPECNKSPYCQSICGNMVRPKRAILLLHELESKHCYPDYPKRYVFSLKDMGLDANEFSLILAIKMASYMGCSSLKLLCFDAHTMGDNTEYIPGKGNTDRHWLYLDQRKKVKQYLEEIDHEWITPTKYVTKPAKKPNIMFGCITNDMNRLNDCLAESELTGQCFYITNPESATKGLNELLGKMTSAGGNIGILTHHDMFYRKPWFAKIEEQLKLLPSSWVIAGIIGKDMHGRICGRMHDTRFPAIFDTEDIHSFPQPAACVDECCIIVNLHKEFVFDEGLDGFDLYGTLCALQTWEMKGTVWIIDSGTGSARVTTDYGDMMIDYALAQHHCTRPFDWFPDNEFEHRLQWLFKRYPNAQRIDSTVFGSVAKCNNIAAA